jgi:hypothetical protein
VSAVTEAEEFDSITLGQTLYFLAPDGRYVVAAPGQYLVREQEGTQLLLIPSQGRQALIVHAHATAHQENLRESVALSVADQQGEIHVVLVMPGGSGLEAIGAPTPMQLRGAPLRVLAPAEVHQAVAQKNGPQSGPK